MVGDHICIPCIGAEKKQANFITELYKKRAIEKTGNSNLKYSRSKALRELITKEYNSLNQ